MKNFHLPWRTLVVCFSLTLFVNKSHAQLSGSYTINPTQPATKTNYLNWASAVGDLISGSRTDGGPAQGAGVSGPVTVTVYDTVYDNTSISITAITGASSANRITFKSQGKDSTKCLLRYASGTSASDDWVLQLNGASYITFTMIGFQRTGTNDYGTVVQFTNSADNNKFIRCLFRGRKAPSSVTKGFQTGIGSCIFFNGNADSTEIRQNHMLYGYNGIYNPNTCAANTFAQNLIDTPGSAGIYVNFQSSFSVIGNTLNMGDFGAGSGHYTCYGLRLDNSSSSQFIVANNKVFSTAVNSQVCRSFVFSANTGLSTSPSLVYNNMIYNNGGTGNCNGMALNGCSYINVVYNNIVVNNSLADGAALFQYVAASGGGTGSKCNLINNNFVNKGGGYAISAGDGLISNFDTIDNNNLLSAGSYLALWGSSTSKYSSMTAFKSASSKCNNCLNLDPGFTSSSDLHVSNIAINGKALPYPLVLKDIDGDTRSTSTPDIGADEFFPVTTDAGLSVVDSPSFFCAGKQMVKVKFQNFGIDTIKKVSIGWSINGVSQTSASWTGSVTSGNSSTSIALGQYTFSGNTAYDFKVWTYNPNGAPDGKPLNDTLKLTKFAALSGSYTIGDTNIANYKSFNAAITAVAERGVCGAVTFNVYNGTYKDQIGLTELPGMGSSSPITFQSLSGDSSMVRLSLPSAANNGSNNAGVQLRGANYVTFKGITFERTGTNAFAQVIHILAGSHHNTFTNCQMLGLQLTAANTTANNIWSDQGQDDYNTFRNNYIKWGNYSMLYQGVSPAVHEAGTVIEHNTFEAGFNNAIYILYNDKVSIKGNKFLDVASALAGNSDVLARQCDSSIEISGNYFIDTKTANSIQVISSKGISANHGLIANNVIQRATGNGIYLDSTSYMGVVFNTINLTSNSGSNSGIFTTGSSDNMMIQNNNIVMQSGEAMHVTSNAEVATSDYNNFLTSGTDFVYWAGARTILSDLQTFTGKDANSLSLNPMFKSSTNLHVQNPLLKGSGTPVAGVTVDFDGDLRSTTKPDIGADEFKLVPNDAGITELYKPIAGVCAGLWDIEIVIRNFGNDTLKTSTVNWSINNVAQPPYAWTGNLPSMQSDTFTIGQFNFLTALNPKFGFGTKMPNGQSDLITFNDSFTANRSLRSLPPLSAGPDRTLCGNDTAMLGVTANPSFGYQWFDMSGASLGNNSKLPIKPSTNATYAVLVTNTAFGCQRRDSVSVTVNPLPTVTAGTDKTICFGTNAQLGTSPQSGFNYSWTSSPVGFTSSIANPSVSPNGTSTYYVKMTNSTTNCFAMDTAMVTIVLYPTPSINGKAAVCDGDVTSYSTNNVSGNSYTWKVTGGQLLNGQSTNSISAKLTPSGNTVVEVIESNTTGCKDTATYAVAVNANPIATFTSTKACFGSATIFGDSTVGDVSQNWEFGDAGTTTVKHPSHTYGAAGNYNTTLMVENAAGCRDTVTKQVSVSPIPVSSYTYAKTANRTYQFTNTSTVSSGTITGWSWDFGDGDTALVQNPSHLFATAGNYTIQLCVKTADGCTHCSSQSISVVGIGQIVYDPQLSAVPNPGAGLYTINSSRTMESVTITNAMGQVVDVVPAGSSALKIDLTAYANGIYFVKVNFGSQTQILKIIKQ